MNCSVCKKCNKCCGKLSLLEDKLSWRYFIPATVIRSPRVRRSATKTGCVCLDFIVFMLAAVRLHTGNWCSLAKQREFCLSRVETGKKQDFAGVCLPANLRGTTNMNTDSWVHDQIYTDFLQRTESSDFRHIGTVVIVWQRIFLKWENVSTHQIYNSLEHMQFPKHYSSLIAVILPRQEQDTFPFFHDTVTLTSVTSLMSIISVRKITPFDPLKISVVSLQKRYNPTLNLRDFHRMRMDFTAAASASASAHVCLLTCCKEASRSIRAEKDGTSGITLLSFPAAYAVLAGDNIYHEAFFFFLFST